MKTTILTKKEISDLKANNLIRLHEYLEEVGYINVDYISDQTLNILLEFDWLKYEVEPGKQILKRL